MTEPERIHELKMTGLNLRPRPKIYARGGRYWLGNGNGVHSESTLSNAIAILICIVVPPELWDALRNETDEYRKYRCSLSK